MVDEVMDLKTWDQLQAEAEQDGREPYSTLVVGNGASINVWNDFAYKTLYKEATKGHPPLLAGTAQNLFTQLGSENFETVLARLVETRTVLKAVGQNTAWIDPMYDAVRDALFNAVQQVHLDYSQLSDANKQRIAEALLANKGGVYVLNYDLIAYWSHMFACDPSVSLPGSQMIDFMFNGTFDPGKTTPWPNQFPIYYPHGGLHLWQDPTTGEVGKYVNGARTILNQARQGLSAPKHRTPLLVSGADEGDKMRTIRQSAYLSLAYQRLAESTHQTVVFGASLELTDSHIARAIASNLTGQRIAISIHVGPSDTPATIHGRKAQYQTALANSGAYRCVQWGDISFFDAKTHPLGQ